MKKVMLTLGALFTGSGVFLLWVLIPLTIAYGVYEIFRTDLGFWTIVFHTVQVGVIDFVIGLFLLFVGFIILKINE